jgi:hypothetical protein
MPPPPGRLEVNFDVAIRKSFAVAAAVLSDDQGEILSAIVECLPSQDVSAGEPLAASLVVKSAASWGIKPMDLEGDSLVVTLAINNQPHLQLVDSPCYL